ncbi:MAG TPA: PAS domain S-box protein [Methanoregula sp.]|nr:PAS domain S-box protein [Methanoregula sp.]
MISVLYIDDEPDLLELGKLFLEQEGTFAVTTAESGPEALALIKETAFDAIISDFQMPEMDGIALLLEIRKRSNIPFILFTGKGREEVVINAINSGADFYLQKGGDPLAQFAELRHKIHQAVSRRHAEDALHKRLSVIRQTSIISSQFIQLVPDQVDNAINELLATIGTQFGAERCSVAHVTKKSATIHWSHEWVDQNVPSQKEEMGAVDPADFSRLVERIKSCEAEIVPDVSALTRATGDDRKVRDFLESLGIKSFVLIPLLAGPFVIGALGISTVTKAVAWPQEDIDILKIYGQIIAGALARRAADKEIHESEALYRTVFESTGTAMMILEEDKTVVVVNREFERISGYTREEVCGRMPWTRFVSPEDVERMQQYHALRRADPSTVPKNYEFRFQARDGSMISTYITVEMIPGTKKSVVSLIDISKERFALAELADSEEKFRGLAESLAEGIYMIQDGRFLYVNPAFAKLFGYPVDEILAISDYTDLFVPEDREDIRRAVTERLAGLKKSERYTRRAVKSDGTIVPVVIHGSRTRYQGKDAIIGTVTGL